jgi:hypothetical protein
MNIDANIAARPPKSIGIIAVVLLSVPLLLTTASAQFNTGFGGQMQLPQDDFTWTWGDRSSAGRGFEDFSIFGNEQGFRCDLTGKLRLGTRISRMDVREIESGIRSSTYFVQAAANAMNNLDAQRELDWATLKCEKPKSDDEDQTERDER